MTILAINCGSSSLKFAYYPAAQSQPQISGNYKEIGSGTTVLKLKRSTTSETIALNAGDHAAAWSDLIDRLGPEKISIRAVGHRIVHGGRDFRGTTRLDSSTIAGIEALDEIAPLHNIPALSAIRAALQSLPETPQYGVFDTAFHANMPKEASLYAVPLHYAREFGVQRFGFHGLAHRSMLEQSAELSGQHSDRGRVITLQLGNGCSGAAILDGRSIDTSMGFSPLEGLVMGTRSGDIDPMAVHYLQRRTGQPFDEILQVLNKGSGLLGVSGISSDMERLLREESSGNEAAALAVNLFCRRVTKLIGSYMALLGGADRIVFGGGIGSNSPEIRRRICQSLSPLGVIIDSAANSAAVGNNAIISAAASPVPLFAVDVDEESIILRETAAAAES